MNSATMPTDLQHPCVHVKTTTMHINM